MDVYPFTNFHVFIIYSMGANNGLINVTMKLMQTPFIVCVNNNYCINSMYPRKN